MEAVRHPGGQHGTSDRAALDRLGIEDAEIAGLRRATERHRQQPAIAFGCIRLPRHEDRLGDRIAHRAMPLLARAGFGIEMGEPGEAAGELAYTSDKADELEIENTSWVGGPSLEILNRYLDQAAAESYIPFEPTLGAYITKEEADLRYANLKAWYEDHGHFWVGTGPYYLDRVFTTEKSLVLKNNDNFVDFADRWDRFSEPKIATTFVDGPGQVKSGEETVFDVTVSFKEDPYPQADIARVKYILYDATGAVVAVGDATALADGQYQVTLSAEETGKLPTGSARLEVAVVPISVAIPSFTSFDFVAVP